jgi:hypothetical protein
MTLRCVIHPLRIQCSNALSKQRLPLPPELMGEVARAAWVDVALWDHAALYLALVSTHPYLREIMPSLAWTYVFCRSRRDFALYLHIRFGSALNEKERETRHTEMHLSVNFQREFEGLVHQRPWFPRLSHIITASASRAIDDGEPLIAAPMTAMYSGYPGVAHPLGAHPDPDLSFLHTDIITDLRVINTYFHSGQHARHHVYPSVMQLTIVYAKNERSDWTEIAPPFKRMFPALRTLTLRGASTNTNSFLSLLPEDLDELVLDARLYSDAGGSGSVHFWDLLAALKVGFKVGGGEHAPRVILLTGAREPFGWQKAVAIADEKGVRLERRIEYRPPCNTSATLRPVPYDLNVVFRDL